MAVFQDYALPDEVTNVLMGYLNSRMQKQEVYAFGLEQIVAGATPADTDLIGWRFLTNIAPGIAIAADVNRREVDQAPVFGGISYGPQIAKAIQSAVNLRTLDTVPPGTYKVVLLRIFGLLIDAFWLRPSISM